MALESLNNSELENSTVTEPELVTSDYVDYMLGIMNGSQPSSIQRTTVTMFPEITTVTQPPESDVDRYTFYVLLAVLFLLLTLLSCPIRILMRIFTKTRVENDELISSESVMYMPAMTKVAEESPPENVSTKTRPDSLNSDQVRNSGFNFFRNIRR